jgi:hypothetical protein
MRSFTVIETVLLTWVTAGWGASLVAADREASVEIQGIRMIFDSQTGCILKMYYPGPGAMIDASGGLSGMVDVAYPLKEFEPFRLASRFSKDARIEKSAQRVTISWERLGGSREFSFSGKVSAVVTIEAAPDGKSIRFACEIDNQTDRPIPQIIFPDFPGIVPFSGEDDTRLTSAASVKHPFLDLAPNEEKASLQHPRDVPLLAVNLREDERVLRWFDLGGLQGGFSMFPRTWAWQDWDTLRLQHYGNEKKLRLMVIQPGRVNARSKWRSEEYWLTPHRGGWAAGVEPYRQWVAENWKREYSLPKHVREGLGFRTVWMSQGYPNDPQDAIFKFSDLPRVARECKEHGLVEIVPWLWLKSFHLPMIPFEHLGGESGLVEAARECKRTGVPIVPFISVVQCDRETAARYGLPAVRPRWNYHSDFIPGYNPPYAGRYASTSADILDPRWQQDVFDGVKHLTDLGMTSLCWDQFYTTSKNRNLNALTEKIRNNARAKDPESSFSAEYLSNMESDYRYLDYTWNWSAFRGDCRVFVNLMAAPRPNYCVTSSPRSVKFGFADNLFLTVIPRKWGTHNGSGWIEDHPELSEALKTCAKLRRQFLKYFTEGRLIGDCILAEPAAGLHVSAYVLPDSALAIVLNDGKAGEVELSCEVGRWIASPSGKHRVQTYDERGKPLDSLEIPAKAWNYKTSLKNSELSLIEFKAKSPTGPANTN